MEYKSVLRNVMSSNTGVSGRGNEEIRASKVGASNALHEEEGSATRQEEGRH